MPPREPGSVNGRDRVRFEGRVLFLTEDPVLVQRQLAGASGEVVAVAKLIKPCRLLQQLGVGQTLGVAGGLALARHERGDLSVHGLLQEIHGGHGEQFFLKVQGQLQRLLEAARIAWSGQLGDEFPEQVDLPEQVILPLASHASWCAPPCSPPAW